MARIATVLLAVAVAGAVALGVGGIAATPQEPPPAPPATSTTTAQSSPAPPPAAAPAAAPITLPPQVLEPVAAVAQQVGPAVVQIEHSGGLGSGVVYDPAGLVLTAAHVVGDADHVRVRLADGTTLDGLVLGAHERTDVAVVRVDTEAPLPAAELALGVHVQPGQVAVALGSPFGLSQSVTAGIVSAIDRFVGGVPMVQTDAAINPGNSGGPLVDAAGRVIGINDQILTDGAGEGRIEACTSGNEGIGFAIAIDLAAIVATQLEAGEAVQLAFLGVTAGSSPSALAGVFVSNVVPGSPAGGGGLAAGDLIVAFDGRPIATADALRARVATTPPGSTVAVTVRRPAGRVTIDVTLGGAPP